MSRRETEVRELLIACDSDAASPDPSWMWLRASKRWRISRRRLATYGPKQNFMGRLPNLPDQECAAETFERIAGEHQLKTTLD
jgi:hypothetical protein